MRLYLRLSAALILLSLAGCNSMDKAGKNSGNQNTTTRAANTTQPTQPQAKIPADGVRRITAAELNEAVQKNEAVIVDVRNADSYNVTHIKGAILIPYNEVAQHLSKLPKDKLIVTYCA